jgi:hypothetical protein
MRDFLSVLVVGFFIIIVIVAIGHDMNVDKNKSYGTSSSASSKTSHYSSNRGEYSPREKETCPPVNFFKSNDNTDDYRSSSKTSSYPSSLNESQASRELEYYNAKLKMDLERDQQYWKLQNELNDLKRQTEIFDQMKEESWRQDVSRSVDNMYFEMQRSSNEYGNYSSPNYNSSDYSVGSSNDVYVNGYYRKNGTYVQSHYRSAPNSTTYDNYGSRRGRH